MTLNCAEKSLEAMKYRCILVLEPPLKKSDFSLPIYKVTEKKQTKEMQAPHSSISAIKKWRCVKYQFSYRDIYLSCIIPGMSLVQVWVNCKMRVAEVVQKEKGWEGEGKPQILQ